MCLGIILASFRSLIAAFGLSSFFLHRPPEHVCAFIYTHVLFLLCVCVCVCMNAALRKQGNKTSPKVAKELSH